MENIDAIMRDLAQYTRMQDDTAAIIDGLRDQLKAIMQAQGVDTLTGAEHKASYKPVISSRIDTSALRRDNPALAEKYTLTTENRRFVFR